MLMRTNNCAYLSIDLVRPAAETIKNKKDRLFSRV